MLIAAGSINIAQGQQPTSTSLATSANPGVFGQGLTLTATVAPGGATGKVTFYDGTTIVGIGAISGGRATLSTKLLVAGVRYLKARYGGDAVFGASTSATVIQKVATVAQNGFSHFGGFSEAGIGANSLAIGDFNGDGKSDVAVTLAGSIGVMLGVGDGTFLPPTKFKAGSQPWFVAVGDFNGDGKADLAVANLTDNNVSILLGNGDGTFKPPVNYPSGNSPYSIAVGDFNGDGQADIAVTSYGGVNVLLGNGDGTLKQAFSYPVGNPLNSPTSVAISDFNGDGRADLVVANPSELSSQVGQFGNNVSILLGNGDGSFQVAVNYKAGANPYFVTVADFNGDGKSDFAVVGANISVFLGNGDGTFHSPVNYIVGIGARTIAVGDFNGDGKTDLATHIGITTPVGQINDICLLIGNGDGTFQSPPPCWVPPPNASTSGPSAPSISALPWDFNGDGRTDLALLSGGGGSPVGYVVVFLGALPIPTFAPTGVVNSASYAGDGIVAPGEIISIFGSGLGPAPFVTLQLDGSGKIASFLGGVQVLFDGLPAPVIFAGFGQLSAIVPYGTGGKVSTQVQVSYQGSVSAPVTMGVFRARPGIFTFDASGRGQGAVLNQDGSVNSGTNPAAVGSYISIYGTGEGQTLPGGVDGRLGTLTPEIPLQRVKILIGGPNVFLGSSAEIQYAGGVYGLVAGVIQINAQIPQGIKSGSAVPLVLRVGDGEFSQVVTIAVK